MNQKKIYTHAFQIVFVLLLLLDCTSCRNQNEIYSLQNYLNNSSYPYQSWKTAGLKEVKIDPAAINNLLLDIEKNQHNVVALLIIRNGKLAVERYGVDKNLYDDDQKIMNVHQVTPDEHRHLHSSTKSVTSALIGMAIDEKLLLNEEQKIMTFFPELKIKDISKKNNQ